LARCQVNNIRPVRRYLRKAVCIVIATLALLSVSGLLTKSELASAAAAATKPQAGTENAAIPSGLNEDEIRDYLAKLPDERVRELLIAELAREASSRTAVPQHDDMFQRLQVHMQNLHRHLAIVFDKSGQLRDDPALLWSQLSAGGTTSLAQLFGSFVLAFFVAWLVEWLYWRAIGTAGRRGREGRAVSVGLQLGTLVLRGVIGLVGIVIFALTAVAAVLMIGAPLVPANPLFVALLRAVVSVRLVMLASQLVFAPRAPSLRLVPLSDVAAHGVYVRIMVVTAVLVLIRFTSVVIREYSLTAAADLVVLSEVALLIVVLVSMIWQGRKPVAAMIRGSDDGITGSTLQERLADSWHLLATVYVAGLLVWAVAYAYATGAVVFGAAVSSLVLVALIPFADMGLRRLVVHLFGSEQSQVSDELGVLKSIGTSDGTDSTGGHVAVLPRQTDSPYEGVALRNLRILLAVLALTVFFNLWDIDPRELATALVGERVGGSVLDIALVLLIAYAVWGFVKTGVERYVRSREPVAGESQEGEGGAPGLTRLETLLPLIRKFMLVAISVVVVMVFLSELGVNIGPLIAGAGIVGIAIGFGAQTLVKDIVSGIFFLLDDAFRMGEYVEIGNTRGRVEKISIRSLQLRHHNGPVHTIPFGEITRLTNYSRDYVIMKFELRVPFETDIDKVRKLIKKVGQEMMEDPELAPLMLGPLKSQGVTHMDDSALIMRCKFTAIPGQQFMVRRAAFTRIQKAFADNDIHFAPRRVIVEATSSLTPEQAASAAAGVLDSEAEKKASGKGKR
jgi:small-conductance mechanosensitive channel